MDIKNNFVFTHDCGDFKVTMEFSAESLEDVVRIFSYFLRGCSFTEGSVDEYFPDF
jgi:hypothetical protein